MGRYSISISSHQDHAEGAISPLAFLMIDPLNQAHRSQQAPGGDPSRRLCLR
jgi:hypothetical protein